LTNVTKIADDIGMGDPEYMKDMDRITRAAELGGAASVIDKLPKKYDTFLSPPVTNRYCMLPKGVKSLFGVKDITNRDTFFGVSSETHSLSGGEYQRLALSAEPHKFLDFTLLIRFKDHGHL
jgi:ABC-type multidrug transport system fused ATPase/permease subunit